MKSNSGGYRLSVSSREAGLDVNDAIVEAGLRELADESYQRRVWLGHGVGEMSSFTECVERLFTDSGLGDALEGQEIVYSEAIDGQLRQLDELLSQVDGHYRDPQDVVDDPRLRQARLMARRVLREVRELG